MQNAIPLFDYDTVIGYYIGYITTYAFEVTVTDQNGDLVDLSTLLGDDGDIFIEARVYS